MTAASSPASPCRVSVVADGPLLRGAVTAALNQAGLVAEATNLDSDRDRAALAEFGPAVVMVHAGQGASLTLGEMTEVVSTVAPRARILVLTESEEEEPLLDAFARGADGFIPMTTSLDDLARTLQTLAHGRSVVDRERLSRLVHPQRRPVDLRHSHDGTVLTLSGRRDVQRPVDRGVLLDEAPKSEGRRAFLRVTAERDADGGVLRDEAGRAKVHLAQGPAGQGSARRPV